MRASSSISALAPSLQHLSFMSSLSLAITTSRSQIFNPPTSNYKTNRQISNMTSFTTRTNTKHVTIAPELDCNIHSFSSMPSPKSLLAHEHRHRFRITLQGSGLIPARSIPVTSLGTSRYFSSSTLVSFNRFAVAPQMIPSRAAALPSARAILSRNASGSGSGNGSKNEKDNNKIQEFMDSTVSSVRTNVGSAEANIKRAGGSIKRAVEELSTGDLLSVYGIVFLIVMIAAAPSIIRSLQSSERDDNHYGDDPVMDLARMIRGEYLELTNRGKANEENEDGENVEDDEERTGRRTSALGLDRIVADLLKSPQIQEAATNLVTKVIQTDQFKTACQVLFKELLKDLLDDPDTLKQVIHLLQNAIVDEKIKEAAVQLATDIFGDNRVLDELVTLVQRLGMENQVQYATQALLVESAHNALNDPEILDHSMEFATDVVGDDVVQQTAGEALYNTMSYAFRPTLSVLLTVLGLGLIFVSVAAFRNVNQIPSDAADRAFLNAIEKTTSRLLKLVFLPLDFLIACKDALVSIILFPFRMITSSISRAGKLGQTLLGSARDWFLWLLYLPAQFLSSMLFGSKQIFETTCANLMDQLNRLGCAVDMSFVGVLFQKWGREMSNLLHRSKIQWIILNHQVSVKILLVEDFGKQIIGGVFYELTKAQGHVTKFSILLQQEGKEYVGTLSKGYHSLNQKLTAFAIFVDEWTRQDHVAEFSILLQQQERKEYIGKLSKGYDSLNQKLAGFAIFVEEWIRSISGIV